MNGLTMVIQIERHYIFCIDFIYFLVKINAADTHYDIAHVQVCMPKLVITFKREVLARY